MELTVWFQVGVPVRGKHYLLRRPVNEVGTGLPADLTVMQEMQLQQLWHAAASLLLIAVIIGHIYIGTMGMEGAFDAMGSGMVDANWAREHHSLWVAETRKAPAARDD